MDIIFPTFKNLKKLIQISKFSIPRDSFFKAINLLSSGYEIMIVITILFSLDVGRGPLGPVREPVFDRFSSLHGLCPVDRGNLDRAAMLLGQTERVLPTDGCLSLHELRGCCPSYALHLIQILALINFFFLSIGVLTLSCPTICLLGLFTNPSAI